MAHGVSQAMQIMVKLAAHALPYGVGHATLGSNQAPAISPTIPTSPSKVHNDPRTIPTHARTCPRVPGFRLSSRKAITPQSIANGAGMKQSMGAARPKYPAAIAQIDVLIGTTKPSAGSCPLPGGGRVPGA
jgi:hypothetical protein